MSKIAAITGALGTTKHKVISKDIASQVTISVGRSDDAAFPINDVIVTMYVKHPSAGIRRTICPRIALIDLAEINTIFPENSVERFSGVPLGAAAAFTNWGLKVQHGWLFKIGLTNDMKGLFLDQDDELVIEFEGVADHANRYLDVWTLEDDENSSQPRVYEELSTGNFKNQKFGVSDCEAISIQRDASLSEIEMKFKNGKIVKMDPSEMDSHLRTAYGVVTNESIALNGDYDNTINKLYPLSERSYIVVLDNVEEIKVNCTGVTPLRVILQK